MTAEGHPQHEIHRDDLLREIERLIGRLTAHADPEVGGATIRLLDDLDAIHRHGLTHLVTGIQAMGGDALLNRLCRDPAVRLLLMSYDLVAVDRILLAEEAIDTVRGHFHAHGVDVELLDVVGGVVYARLHGLTDSGVEEAAVRRDLESALREYFLGFQELEFSTPPGYGVAAESLVQLQPRRPLRQPIYHAIDPDVLPGVGELTATAVAGDSILLANLEGTIHAALNQCGSSPLPLEFSEFIGHEIVCSWHGCRYDVRTGHGEGTTDRLLILPIRQTASGVEVAIGTQEVKSP